jgi:hypothetical protein
MGEKISKPLTISKTPPEAPRRAGFRAAERPASRRPWRDAEALDEHPGSRRHPLAGGVTRDDSARRYRLQDLAREWMLDLQVLGPSQRTLDRYRQKLDAYFARGCAESLEDFTAHEVKRALSG